MPSVFKRNIAIFIAVGLIWIILDQLSKFYFASFKPGELIAGPFGGIFQFELVRNTGGAWGLFGNGTLVLALISVAVCLVIVIYLIKVASRSSVASVVGLALVFGGGVGNALDRFIQGYVVDFISPVFIDFPVFNIADIGVTCGAVIFIISLIVSLKDDTTKDDDLLDKRDEDQGRG